MNRRGASLIICLSLVINSLVLNIPKSSFESLNNDKDLKIDSETKILTDNLCNYFQATENLGLQDDMGLDLSTYEKLLSSPVDTCKEENNLSAAEIYALIEKNTTDYVSLNSTYANPFTDKYYTNHEFNNQYDLKIDDKSMLKIKAEIEEIVKNNIDFILQNGNNSDIHNYKDLKIVLAGGILGSKMSSSAYATYEMQNNIIKINMPLILNDSGNLEDILTRLDQVISHEFRHVEQEPCVDEKENGITTSTLCVDDNYYNFLDEASAESSLVNLGVINDLEYLKSDIFYSYENYRKLESQLFLCSMFDNDKKLSDYYKAIRSHDNNGLLEFLGASLNTEKEELIRVIYAMNSITGNTSYLEELTGKDSDYDSKDTSLMLDKIKYLYNITIMKYSLKSLINYNLENKKDLSLEENVFLYYLVVSNLVDNSINCDNNVYSYYSDFLEEYQVLKNNYFRVLSKIYGVSTEAIDSIYLDYNNSEINYELGCYFGNMIGDNEFQDDLYSNQEIIKKVLQRFPKLKAIAFLKYRNIKEKSYAENTSVEILEGVIAFKNVSINYTVK